MVGELRDNDGLIQEIMRLSEEAAQFHGAMAGSVVFPESFIRDWVAIKLHKPDQPDRQPKLGVTIETAKEDVRKYLVDTSKWETHDLLKLTNYRLDMIVWEEPDRPRAIVEFKRSPLVCDDLDRTSKILSVAQREGLGGYVVACIAFDRKDQFAGYKAGLDATTSGMRDGDVLAREPAQAPNGLCNAWCGVFAIKAKLPSL